MIEHTIVPATLWSTDEMNVKTEYGVLVEVTHNNGAFQALLKLVKAEVPNGHYELYLLFEDRPYNFDVLVIDGKMESLSSARMRALTARE